MAYKSLYFASNISPKFTLRMQQVLLNNQHKPYFKWEYDAENKWLYMNWIGYISKENLIKAAEEILVELQQNHYAFILNDNRELCGPWDQANEWLKENWIPKVKEAGLRYFAHVLSPGIAGALSAQSFHQEVDGSFNMQLFGDMEKAQAWLKAAQKTALQNK
jgi:hypothetical protein